MGYAVLPENLEESGLKDLLPGEVCWTLPWGMWVDTQRRCWLHPNYPVSKERAYNFTLFVARLGDGYHAWVTHTDYKWRPAASPGYVSPEDTPYIPVVEIHQGSIPEVILQRLEHAN